MFVAGLSEAAASESYASSLQSARLCRGALHRAIYSGTISTI